MNYETVQLFLQIRAQLSEPTRLRSYRTENIVASIDTQLQNWVETFEAKKANHTDNIPF